MKLSIHFRCKFSTAIGVRLDFKDVIARQQVHRQNALDRMVSTWPIDTIVARYGRYCELTKAIQSLQHKRRVVASEAAKSEALLWKGRQLKEEIGKIQSELDIIQGELHRAAMQLPNLTSTTQPTPPVGGADVCVEESRFGPPLIPGSSSQRDHVALGKDLGVLEFESARVVSGSQFYYLQGSLALLELALIQWAMKVCVEAGWQPILTPDLVRQRFVEACGFSPRSSQEEELPVYRVVSEGNREQLALVGTAEVPLAALYHGQVLGGDSVIRRLVGFGHCFRPETGHHGTECRGLYRVHQFSKVELFALTRPGHSDAFLRDTILSLQKAILEPLGMTCRILRMSTGELGASAAVKYDIEAWLPWQKRWGELASASNCTDFQSRRLNIKIDTGEWAHSLNGTAMAVPRVIQGIMETGWDERKQMIHIPPCLWPFMLDGSRCIQKIR